MTLVALAVGLFFTSFGLWYLYRPRLQLFYQLGVFHRQDGEVGPAERMLGRIGAAVMLAIGLSFDWLWLRSVGFDRLSAVVTVASGLVVVWLSLRFVD